MKNNVELQGKVIKKVFEKAKPIADLHAVLTSSTGNYFRLRLLQTLRKGLVKDQLKDIRKEAKLHEQTRHMDKIVAFKLAEYKQNIYKRTEKGERALNAVREFERKVGKEEADKIFKASLGENSIKLFLSVYGHKKHIESHPFLNLFQKSKRLTVKYSPSEIGRIAGLLSRTVDGISAIDKLDDSGILKYEDDGDIHFSTIKAHSFYQYLKRLYEILES